MFYGLKTNWFQWRQTQYNLAFIAIFKIMPVLKKNTTETI